jgi:hypothetical protein
MADLLPFLPDFLLLTNGIFGRGESVYCLYDNER